MGVCYTSSHIHIFIFTSTQIILKSSHLHIFIFTSTQIILKSSHFHILTSAHLHTSSHIFSHLLSSSHLHIFTSSHFLSLSLSCPLALCHGLSPSFSFLSLAVPTRRNEVQSSKTEVKLRLWRFRGNHFARNEVRSSKAEGFLRLWLVRRQPFRTK